MSQTLLGLQEKYSLIVSKWICYKVRSKVLKILIGTYREHYARLGSYKAELQRVDKKGIFGLHLL